MRLEHVFLHVLAHAANCSTANSEVLVKLSLSGTLPPLNGEEIQARASTVTNVDRPLAAGTTGTTLGASSRTGTGGLAGAVHAPPRFVPHNLIHVNTSKCGCLVNTPLSIRIPLAHFSNTHKLCEYK